MKPKLIVFFDLLGRTILGTLVKETDTTVSVQNPAVIHVQPDPQNGRLSLQALPLFFREFQADKSEPTVWHYNKSYITTAEPFELDFRFQAQYEQLFSSKGEEAAPSQPEPKLVKLFED